MRAVDRLLEVGLFVIAGAISGVVCGGLIADQSTAASVGHDVYTASFNTPIRCDGRKGKET